MGGAADLPQRSSSPLKRRASDLEASDVPSSQKDDVDMVPVPSPEQLEPSKSTDTTQDRAQSVDMLRDDAETESSNDPPGHSHNMEMDSAAVPPVDPQDGT